MPEQVLYDCRDGVAVIALNRPDRLNAWTAAMATQLRAAVQRADADAAVRVIVITGEGRGFCAGADLAELQQRAAGSGAMTPPAHNRFDYLVAAHKPLVAAVNGAAAGIGFVVPLYCDLIYLAAGSKFTTAFSRRGLPAEYASAWLLPQLIGRLNAADLLLSGRVVLAEEAARMGLGRLLPAEGFRDAVLADAQAMARLCSPRSISVIKRQMRLAREQTLEQAMLSAEEELAEARQSEDFREGVAHHMEKRPPRFTGR